MKARIFHCIIFLFAFSGADAETYYISNNGNDASNGLSPVFALKSLTKLNSILTGVQPGDVILFERGSYFSGQITIHKKGNESQPVIFGAYGEGRNPIISGAIPIKGWSDEGKIFTVSVDTVIKNLYMNGQQLTIARYPNSGYLTIKEPFPNPKNGFRDKQLNQQNGYWNGSNVRMRTNNWTFEYTPVKNFSGGSITFLNPTVFPVVEGWGYFLDNNLSVLDTAGEWYYDGRGASKGIIYFYTEDGINPDNKFTEGSVYNFGIYSHQELTNLIIRDLEFRNQNISGIHLVGMKSKIQIENCTFRGQVQFGINFTNQSNLCKISNCRFYNINGTAIYTIKANNSIFSNNIFSNTGLIPGYGLTGNSFGNTAMAVLSGDSNHLFNNNINGAGHDGINCIGTYNIIEKNVISNSMLLLNDGGAIKSYGYNTKNSVVKNNFIFNVPGNREGTSLQNNRVEANGVYIDAYCNNVRVLDNTILGCGASGIDLFENTNNNFFNGNVCYNNEIGITFFDGLEPMSGNLTTNNIFFSTEPAQVSVRLMSYSSLFIPGRFDSNYYCNAFKEDLFLYTLAGRNAEYDFGVWKRLMGRVSDSHSKIVTGPALKFSKLFKNMSDDTLLFLLDPLHRFKDLNLNEVYGSITLPPWTSKILLPGIDINNLAYIETAGGQLNFETITSENYHSPQWYNLIAKNVNSAVTVTAPDGFTVSLQDDVNFSKTLLVESSSGNVNRIIFVRFDPSEEKGYYDFIVNSSGDVKSNVKVIGSR